jgi:Uncharacterized protein conserved in bacteria
LFDELGIDYVIPEPSSKISLERGSVYSPEEMCLPFKIMLGNYLQAIESGADTIIITGSCGPCRYGEYCELQINLMKKLRKDINFIVIDSPFDIGFKELLNRIHRISDESKHNNIIKFKALYDAYTTINYMDSIEKVLRYKAGYEKKAGECKDLLAKCKREAMKCSNASEMIKLLKCYKILASKVEVDKNKKPLKVALIGEIYTMLEPFSNLFIEDKLMDFGVSTKRGLYPSWWFKDMLLSSLNLNSMDIKKASKKYLPYYIGGHGKECIGEAVIACDEGFDGIIQVFPLGCMPEIVAKSILPTVSQDKNIPIMTLVVDEMTGEAGYVTRIEAFLDLLERRNKSCII